MAVYVDAMVKYGVRRGRAGPRWCHMIADSPKELHAMAARIGLRRTWFQAKASVPHYDIGTDRIRGYARGVVKRPEDQLGVAFGVCDNLLFNRLCDRGFRGTHEASSHVDAVCSERKRRDEST